MAPPGSQFSNLILSSAAPVAAPLRPTLVQGIMISIVLRRRQAPEKHCRTVIKHLFSRLLRAGRGFSLRNVVLSVSSETEMLLINGLWLDQNTHYQLLRSLQKSGPAAPRSLSTFDVDVFVFWTACQKKINVRPLSGSFSEVLLTKMMI